MIPLPPLTWVLCDSAGDPLPGSHRATNRRLIASRNRSMEARLTTGIHDEVTTQLFAALANGIPQLRVSLGDTLIFSGTWVPMQGEINVNEWSPVNLVFRDAFDRLAYRWSNSTVPYTAEDAGLIALDLIDSANTELFFPKPHTGIMVDPAWIEPTVDRDRSYNDKMLGEALQELTEVRGGFDWYPTYLDPRDNAEAATARFNVVAQQGTDRPDVRFELGPGTLANCTGCSFVTTLPITQALAQGITSTTTQFASTHGIYGTIGVQIPMTDTDDIPLLAAKAFDALRPRPVHVTDFRPDPAKAPQPLRDFWIGDTVRWNVDYGAMQQQTEPRVQTIEIGVDDSDRISDLVVGIDPAAGGSYLPPSYSTRAYVQREQELRRRLNALERG